MVKLKPCPFCGETPDHDSLINQGYDDPQWWIECSNVDCPVAPGCGDSCRETVREQWNTRANTLMKEMAEYIHDLLTKIVRYGYDFQLETELENGKAIMQKHHEHIGER